MGNESRSRFFKHFFSSKKNYYKTNNSIQIITSSTNTGIFEICDRRETVLGGIVIHFWRGEVHLTKDFVLHFLFFLFRAFHSPSWVAKLPKSSLTFLFLSASLKHQTYKVRAAQKWQQSSGTLFSLWSSPAHDFAEFLSRQEARILPDLPQSTLELFLVLVLQSFLLLLFSGAASLLPVVQPEERGGEI